MRTNAWLAALPLLIGLLAGCSSSMNEGAPRTLWESDITVPTGAHLEAVPGGFALTWQSLDLPVRQNITIPPHATMVRAVTNAEDAVTLSMINAETGRRRCNNPTVESMTQPLQGERTCSSIALIDRPGAIWQVRAAGFGATMPLRVEFLSTPIDGLLANVDFSQIDPPALKLQPTQVLMVPSFDGMLLRVEVTLPEGPGPWPAIIESSPYHDDGVRANPASWAYFVQDWAKRGYAIVVADVRGFGDSQGCVEIWGPNEQKDQAFLVDWTAKQSWSNGRVGFYGQSYVATTPVEAAILHPAALKAIIAVAPVINSYEDWHHGGVPDGENTGSAVGYQVETDDSFGKLANGQPPNLRTDPMTLATTSTNGLCDPTLIARANDPRSIVDQFYNERNFKLHAQDVTAAVLYTQGFEDLNVKSDMIPGWFNELKGPKLGLFGHWLHQHPPRMDTEALMVAWNEQYVKGKALGLAALPQVDVLEAKGTHRLASEWPPTSPVETTLWLDFAHNALSAQSADGSATVTLDGTGGMAGLPASGPTQIVLNGALATDTSLAGVATVHTVGTLTGAGTGYVQASLYDVDPATSEAQLYAWGAFNVAHNADHTEYRPVTPSDVVTFDLPLRTTEHIFPAGHGLRLVLEGSVASNALAGPTDPNAILDGNGGLGATGVQFTFQGGADGTRLVIPGVPMNEYAAAPLTATS